MGAWQAWAGGTHAPGRIARLPPSSMRVGMPVVLLAISSPKTPPLLRKPAPANHQMMPSPYMALTEPRMLAVMGALFTKQRVGGAHNPAPVTKSQTVLSLGIGNSLSDLSPLAAGGPQLSTIDRMWTTSGKVQSKEGWRIPPSFISKITGTATGAYCPSTQIACHALAMHSSLRSSKFGSLQYRPSTCWPMPKRPVVFRKRCRQWERRELGGTAALLLLEDISKLQKKTYDLGDTSV